MASIPLPALASQAPPNPVDQYSKILEMKSLMGQQQLQQQQVEAGSQENQMRQMQLEDMNTVKSIAPKYVQKDEKGNVTGYDFDGLTNGAIAAGVRPQSLAQLQAMRKNAADTLLAQENAKKGALENQNTINDQLSGHLEAFRNAPAEMKQSTLNDAMATAKKNNMPWQLPTDATQITPQMLDTAETSLAMHSQHVKEAQEQAATAKDAAETLLKQNEADMIQTYRKNPQLLLSQVDSIAPPKGPNGMLNARTRFAVQRSLEAGDVPGAKEAIKSAAQEVGAIEKEKYVQGQENLRQDHNRQAMQSNELQRAGLNSLDKMFTDPQHGYSQFLAQANSTKSALAEAKDGNELAASLAPLMTVLGVNSFAGIHRVNPQEIAAAGPGVGSLYRRANTIIDKAVSGTMNEDTRKEMSTVIDGLINAKHAALVPSAQLVVKNAGLDPAKTSILDKDGSMTTLDKVSTAPAPKQTTTSTAPPAGATHIAPGSDGKKHYTNAKGEDLGAVPDAK